MSDFTEALKLVLIHEGGYVDHPLDSGGPTRFGITMATLSEYLGRPVSKDDIAHLQTDTVRQIYKKNYWDKMRLDEVKSNKLASVLFDLSVLRGIYVVTRDLQGLLKLKIDGLMGSLTIGALNAFDDDIALCIRLVHASHEALASIVEHNRNQSAFIVGWTKRLNSLVNYSLDMV